MEYVEIQRSRRILTWFTAIVAVGVVLGGIGVVGHHMHVNGHVPAIPASALIALVAFGTFILAAIVSPGLNNEESTIAISWTRPMSRDQIAWRYVAVDLITIAIGALVVACAIVVECALAGVLGYVFFDGKIGRVVLEAAGCTAMWYGLCLVAAARMPERAGLIAGLSWGAFIVLVILVAVPLPPVLHGLVMALNYLNPLAYFSGSDKSGSLLAGPPLLKMFAVWLIAIVALVAAVRLWSTREA